MSAFVIKKVNTGIMFNLKADNGQVIATSEVYTAAASCKNGIDSVRRNAPIAALEDQTVEGFAAAKCPKFELYVDNAGEFRFRLKATNGEIIAASHGSHMPPPRFSRGGGFSFPTENDALPPPWRKGVLPLDGGDGDPSHIPHLLYNRKYLLSRGNIDNLPQAARL